MNEPRATSVWRDLRTGETIASLYGGDWPPGVGPETIQRHRPVNAVERTLTGPEREAKARAELPTVVAQVVDLRRRVLDAADVAEGDGELGQVLETLGPGVVGEVGRLRGGLVDLRTPMASQHLGRAGGALDAAWARLPQATGQSGSDRAKWTSERACRDLGTVALELEAAWRALADLAAQLDVDVAPAPSDTATTQWWDKASDVAAALSSASGMVNRAVGPARRASGDRAGAAVALEAAELELLRLANVAGELAAEVSARG